MAIVWSLATVSAVGVGVYAAWGIWCRLVLDYGNLPESEQAQRTVVDSLGSPIDPAPTTGQVLSTHLVEQDVVVVGRRATSSAMFCRSRGRRAGLVGTRTSRDGDE